jgi:hypothetical protein
VSLKAFILFMPLNLFKDKCLNPYASIRKALQLMLAASSTFHKHKAALALDF